MLPGDTLLFSKESEKKGKKKEQRVHGGNSLSKDMLTSFDPSRYIYIQSIFLLLLLCTVQSLKIFFN